MKRSEFLIKFLELAKEYRKTNEEKSDKLTEEQIADLFVGFCEQLGMLPPATTVEFQVEEGHAQLFVDNVWEPE